MSGTGTDLERLLRRAVRSEIAKIRTTFVGVVRAFDASSSTVDVEPVNKRLFRGEDGSPRFVSEPVIPSVPVVFIGGPEYADTHRIEVGQFVLCTCAERSTDEWQDAPRAGIEPAINRRFDVSDAFAVPIHVGPAPSSSERQIGETGAGGRKLRFTASGVRFGTPSADVLDVLDGVLGALQSATVATTSGPTPLDPATQATLAALRAELSQVRG